MMLVLCLILVIVAIGWGLPRPAARDIERRLDRGNAEMVRPRSPSVRRLAAVVIVSLGTILVAVILDGARGAVLAASGVTISLTLVRLVGQRRRLRTRLETQVSVSRACSAVAAQLGVGQVPMDALASAARDHPVLTESQRVSAVGGDVPRAWRSQAERADGCAGLAELARAWQVSVDTGAPMSTTLEQVAAGLSADRNLQSVIAGELAAPRATSKVMAVLPACGIGLGYLLGGDPLGWLLAGPLGWGCLSAGVLLACAGVLWIETLARQAAT
jgi:tight adherence protein B